jgi:hypothetical protein
MTDDYDVDPAELLHTPWAYAMFEFVTDWHGGNSGMPDEADQVLVRIVQEMRRCHKGSLTEQDIQRIRLRVLSLATVLRKSPKDADTDLFAEFERQLREHFLVTLA